MKDLLLRVVPVLLSLTIGIALVFGIGLEWPVWANVAVGVGVGLVLHAVAVVLHGAT